MQAKSLEKKKNNRVPNENIFVAQDLLVCQNGSRGRFFVVSPLVAMVYVKCLSPTQYNNP